MPSTTFKTPINLRNIPEQLALLIMEIIPNEDGQELKEAFLTATDFPPITKLSLTELDIQSIITNIKLRHDCNFDKDLSFRPNLDGNKGYEKMVAARKYWKALEAELIIYVSLFQGNHTPASLEHWPEIVSHAQRRIPKIFNTVKEILKTLVPDRDHSRVDEHLDIPMLMREIERGVCDLVRLSEWLACLLKEHCAPMRDDWVDKMVNWTRSGVAEGKSESIVNGLRELLGILEAMKLDVANHQIRNLKGLLIDDTVHFQRTYHLEKLVNTKPRVNIVTAQEWYSSELQRPTTTTLCKSTQRDTNRFGAETLSRAVLSILLSNDQYCQFPDTFYLDDDRLRMLKSEMDYHIYFEICYELFGRLLSDLGFSGTIPSTSKPNLRLSLAAIVGESCGDGYSQWRINSENVSLEVTRQALILSGRSPHYASHMLTRTNRTLRSMFKTSYSKHSAYLKKLLESQISSCIARHSMSSPTELFNTFVAHVPPQSPTFNKSTSPLHVITDSTPAPADHVSDFANRIAHMVILHWRIWGDIAYVSKPSTNTPEITVTTKPNTTQHHHVPPAPTPTAAKTSSEAVLTVYKTGEPPESGPGTLESPAFPH